MLFQKETRHLLLVVDHRIGFTNGKNHNRHSKTGCLSNSCGNTCGIHFPTDLPNPILFRQMVWRQVPQPGCERTSIRTKKHHPCHLDGTNLLQSHRSDCACDLRSMAKSRQFIPIGKTSEGAEKQQKMTENYNTYILPSDIFS